MIQDVTAIIMVIFAAIGGIWTVYTHKKNEQSKKTTYLKNSGQVGNNAQSGGGHIAGRDIKR